MDLTPYQKRVLIKRGVAVLLGLSVLFAEAVYIILSLVK